MLAWTAATTLDVPVLQTLLVSACPSRTPTLWLLASVHLDRLHEC